MFVKLINHTPNPVAAIEEAASLSYSSEVKTPGKIMNHCYDSGHHSVFEFVDFTFHIQGISRACLAQLTRYRMATFNVRSQRHCSEVGADWVVPLPIYMSLDAWQLYESALAEIERSYKELIDMGIPLEDARYLLPNATPTELHMKMNLRELMHFCNQRLCNRAQAEIRDLAQEIRAAVIEVMPEAKRFLVPQCEIHTDNPFCTEAKSCGRHQKPVRKGGGLTDFRRYIRRKVTDMQTS